MGRKNKEKMDEKQLEESLSIYKRINSFKDKVKKDNEDEYIKELMEYVDNGKYSSVEEARKRVPMKKWAHGLMGIFAGKSLSKATQEEKMCVMDHIIRDVLQIDPVQFCNIFSTANNKHFKINNLIDSIIEGAPEDIVVRSCFDQKTTLFRYMYPDLDFGTKLKEVTGENIFNCEGSMRSGLCKAANTLKTANSKSSKIYTKIADNILMNAINEVIALKNLSVEESFKFLAEETGHFFKKDDKIAGINFVCEKRYDGGNLLDFYYLNSGKEFQRRYCHEFYRVREMIKDIIPPNKDLELGLKFLMKKYPPVVEEVKKKEEPAAVTKEVVEGVSDLTERLFWLELNRSEKHVTGYLLNEEQLLEETQVTPESFDKMKHKNRALMGRYSNTLSYIVRELHTMEEVKDALTWKDFSFDEDITTERLKKRYPAYVAKEYRLFSKVTAPTGVTKKILPLSGDENETAIRYCETFNLSDDDIKYTYSPREMAMIDILNELLSGRLTEDSYAGILSRYELDPVMQEEEDEDIEK